MWNWWPGPPNTGGGGTDMAALLARLRVVFGPNALLLAPVQLVLGLGLALLVHGWLHQEEQQHDRAALEYRAALATDAVAAAMREAGATLNALAAFVTMQDTVTPASFDNFAGLLLRQVHGIQALAWVEEIRAADLAAAEQRIATAGYPGFHVRERGADGKDMPVAPRERYAPVMMIHPMAGNAAAHGFDLASREDRRTTLDLAREAGRSVMTPRLTLVQEQQRQYATIIFQPVYQKSGQFRGFADGVFRIGELMQRQVGAGAGQDVGIAVFDRTDPGDPQLLYPADLARSARELLDAGAVARDVRLNERTWTVVAWRVPDQIGSNSGWRSTLVLLFGVFVTITLVAFYLVSARSRASVAIQVALRTSDLNRTLGQLHDSQSRFQDFLSIASDWYWETAIDYRFTYKSHGSGEHGDGIRQLIALDRMMPDDPELEVMQRRTMLDRHEPFRGLRCILTTEEGQMALTLDGLPVFDNDGAFAGFRGSARDTTSAAKAEAAERSALVAAQTANRSKSAFLANMSHEIRTPMNGLIGMAQILRHSGLSEEQKQHVNVMLRSAQHLLTVINDILDYSKLEEGSIMMEQIPCDLIDLVNDVASLVRQSAEEKGVALLCDLPDPVPARVLSDPVRIRQILLNLVTNAVKFTSAGSVRIAMQIEELTDGDTGGRLAMRLAVTDTGIGMDASTIARLFTRFMQADASSTRRFGGTGLGLSIAQRLAGLLGGEITVESRLGAGSVFTLHLALGIAGEAPPSAFRETPVETEDEPGIAPRTLRILVAEDDEINQLVLSGFLEPYGHAVTIVRDGAAVVEALRQGTYDVVLMDVMMPGTDGLQATRMIRALEGPKRDIPIIALTANAMAGDRETYLDAGMTDYVSKPIARAELYRVIEAQLKCRAFARVFRQRPMVEEAAVPAQAGGTATELHAFIDALELE